MIAALWFSRCWRVITRQGDFVLRWRHAGGRHLRLLRLKALLLLLMLSISLPSCIQTVINYHNLRDYIAPASVDKHCAAACQLQQFSCITVMYIRLYICTRKLYAYLPCQVVFGLTLRNKWVMGTDQSSSRCYSREIFWRCPWAIHSSMKSVIFCKFLCFINKLTTTTKTMMISAK